MVVELGLGPRIETQVSGRDAAAATDEPTTVPGEGLRRAIEDRTQFVPVQLFAAQLVEMTHRVGKVVLPNGGEGTGFLVGRRAVLTANHVIGELGPDDLLALHQANVGELQQGIPVAKIHAMLVDQGLGGELG